MGTAVSVNGSQYAENHGIAKITDTGDHILVSCDLKSTAAVTAAGGTVVGTASFDSDLGMDPGSAGSIRFQAITGYQQLDDEGQIVVKVQPNGFAEYDDSASVVSGSQGVDRSAGGKYILSGLTSSFGAHTRVFVDNTEQLSAKMHASDTLKATKMTTIGKDNYVELCLWWKGNEWGLLTDGAPYTSGTRANFVAGILWRITVGATGASGTDNSLDGYYFKDIIISRRSPRFFSKQTARSIGLFGDSFVKQMEDAAASPFWDCAGYDLIHRKLADAGKKARIEIDGYNGYTICDTTSNDLSNEIAGFAALKTEISVIIAGNNDIDLSAVNWATNALGTGGIDENLKAWITTLYSGGCKKIYICNAGSVKQATTKDVAQAPINMAAYNAILNALPGWFDAANPTDAGLVEIVDLFTLLGGDQTVNYNYQGQWNLDGNVTTGAGSLDNRHPHPQGQKVLIDHIMDKVLKFK